MYPPTLRTSSYVLKAYETQDEDRFVETGLDPDVVAFMGNADGDEQAERAVFQKIFKIYKQTDNKRWFWIWGIYKNDLLCGHLELKETENTNANELEIVYMVHPSERKKGLMGEVLAHLKTKQKEWGRTIIATFEPANITSLKLLQKWGITKEETIKDPEGDYLKVWLA